MYENTGNSSGFQFYIILVNVQCETLTTPQCDTFLWLARSRASHYHIRKSECKIA